MQQIKFEYRITLAYFLIGSLWILLSDQVIEIGSEHTNTSITHYQTVKGWFYVTTTSLLLLVFVRKHLGRLRISEQELEKHRSHLAEMVEEKTKKLDTVIVELKETNEQLNKRNNDLRKALDEVRATHAQLAQADRMAAIGTLTHGIANEINTPLQTIEKSAVDILEELKTNQNENENIASNLEQIHKCTHRIATITSGVKQLSSNNYTLYEKCDIHAIIDNCVAILNYQISEKIQIQRDFLEEDLYIKGNPGQLHQAIISIMINAVHSIREEGLILISTGIKKGVVLLTITDTGCGIDPSHLSHITTPFFTTKEPGKGTGLGLSITYTIIQNHGGDLRIASEPEKGTVITIELPVHTN
jgi:two-component system NtrC family sensor kinase